MCNAKTTRMKYNNTTVKNPLTIIAIFSGISEISGTGILPFLEPKNQETFIWFLMLFPFFLVLLFFATLNWNHKVLYAPSDFSDENHFVNLLGKATAQETYEKIKDELNEVENIQNEPIIEGDAPQEEIIENIEPVEEITDPKEQRESDSKIVKDVTTRRIQDIRLAELLILSKLEKEFNLPIQKDMKLHVGTNSMIFDGVIEVSKNVFLCIDIRYFRSKNSFNHSMWEKLKSKYQSLFTSLDDSQKNSFKLMFVAVTSDDVLSIDRMVRSQFLNVKFPVDIRVYDFDSLK